MAGINKKSRPDLSKAEIDYNFITLSKEVLVQNKKIAYIPCRLRLRIGRPYFLAARPVPPGEWQRALFVRLFLEQEQLTV